MTKWQVPPNETVVSVALLAPMACYHTRAESAFVVCTPWPRLCHGLGAAAVSASVVCGVDSTSEAQAGGDVKVWPSESVLLFPKELSCPMLPGRYGASS